MTERGILGRVRDAWTRARREQAPGPDQHDEKPPATADDVRACYRLLLGREPDPSGWSTYTSQVRAGISVDDLVRSFLLSPEFRERRLAGGGAGDEATPRAVSLDGFELYVKPDDWTVGSSIEAHRAYEPAVTAAMEAALEPGMVVADVGASIGYYTVLAGRAVGPRGHVHAFEPGPQNLSVLLLNVASNDLGHATVHPVALSDGAGVLVYDRLGGNGIVGDFDGDVAALDVHELVQAATLDDVLGGADRLDVMKVDVEGAEYRALRGGEQVLARHRPLLFVEFSPPGLRNVSGVDGRALLDFLTSLGYRFTALPTGDLGEPRDCGADHDAVLAAFEATGTSHVDLVARPR